MLPHQDGKTPQYRTQYEPVPHVLQGGGVAPGQDQSLVQVNVLVVISLQDELGLQYTQ